MKTFLGLLQLTGLMYSLRGAKLGVSALGNLEWTKCVAPLRLLIDCTETHRHCYHIVDLRGRIY